MDALDWTTFNTRITIAASKEKIFDYLTTQENIELWFLRKALFSTGLDQQRASSSRIEKGDQYTWEWHGSDDVAKGEILNIDEPHQLAFTFLDCHVTIEIKEEEGETMVQLTQSQISLDDASRMSYYVGCTRGWTFYMTNLKSILEGGIDLRNKNGRLHDVINT